MTVLLDPDEIVSLGFTFTKAYQPKGVVSLHLVQGRSPRCVSRHEEPATAAEFLAGEGWVEREGKPYRRWPCALCVPRLVRLVRARGGRVG